jgi:hypothetical protein
MNLILIIMLGCNIKFIMDDRISTAINFANNYAFPDPYSNNIDWILSGGIKNKSQHEEQSEAEKMAEIISSYETPSSNWDYLLDEKSTNTAENFVEVKRYLAYSARSEIKYSKVYVVTSEFHYERAKKFADILIPNNKFDWILSKEKEPTSEYWERIHMKNIEADITKVFNKFKFV